MTVQENNLPDEIAPMNDILWDVIYRIFEVEPIAVAIYRTVVALFKADLVDIVAESQLLSSLRYCVKTLSTEPLC